MEKEEAKRKKESEGECKKVVQETGAPLVVAAALRADAASGGGESAAPPRLPVPPLAAANVPSNPAQPPTKLEPQPGGQCSSDSLASDATGTLSFSGQSTSDPGSTPMIKGELLPPAAEPDAGLVRDKANTPVRLGASIV